MIITRAPNRPTNIVRHKSNLPAVVSAGVMPVLRPTVLKADTASKEMLMSEAFSIAHRVRMMMRIKEQEKKSTETARCISTSGM